MEDQEEIEPLSLIDPEKIYKNNSLPVGDMEEMKILPEVSNKIYDSKHTLCVHGILRYRCILDNPSSFCEHGNYKYTCKLDRGSICCKHYRRVGSCKICTSSPLDKHIKKSITHAIRKKKKINVQT